MRSLGEAKTKKVPGDFQPAPSPFTPNFHFRWNLALSLKFFHPNNPFTFIATPAHRNACQESSLQVSVVQALLARTTNLLLEWVATWALAQQQTCKQGFFGGCPQASWGVSEIVVVHQCKYGGYSDPFVKHMRHYFHDKLGAVDISGNE